MEPEVEILSPEERQAVVESRADEAAAYAKERYGVDLARVGSDPGEAMKLVRAYAADALLDRRSSRLERGAAAKMLLESIPADERKSNTSRRDRLTGSAGQVRKALFGGDARETGS